MYVCIHRAGAWQGQRHQILLELEENYGMLLEFVCCPCARAMIISVLFQFQHMGCQNEQSPLAPHRSCFQGNTTRPYLSPLPRSLASSESCIGHSCSSVDCFPEAWFFQLPSFWLPSFLASWKVLREGKQQCKVLGRTWYCWNWK